MLLLLNLHCTAIVTCYMMYNCGHMYVYHYGSNSFCVLCIDTGRGLMALKYFKSGDIIISLPERLLITSNSILHSSGIGPVLHRFVKNCNLSCIIVLSVKNIMIFSL